MHRELPQVDQIHETKVAELSGCPKCRGEVAEIHEHEQTVTDIPVVEVKNTRYITYSGYCQACQRRVRSPVIRIRFPMQPERRE